MDAKKKQKQKTKPVEEIPKTEKPESIQESLRKIGKDCEGQNLDFLFQKITQLIEQYEKEGLPQQNIATRISYLKTILIKNHGFVKDEIKTLKIKTIQDRQFKELKERVKQTQI